MKTITTRHELTLTLAELRKNFKGQMKIGFVPTMGALHQGHISLVENARKECDVVVTSIFVNPTQFNEAADLQNYPRTLDADSKKLLAGGCDIVFAPDVKEIYPKSPVKLMNIDFGPLENIMEGKFRPGHFKGMATVVYKLFDLVKPDIAYFGEKDYQQFFIIRQMVQMLNMGIQVIGCTTLREKDGLAMSSRNMRLNTAERKAAAELSKVLACAQQDIQRYSISQTCELALATLITNPLIQPEYFEIMDERILQPVESRHDSDYLRAFVAARVGSVRLIDNLPLYLSPGIFNV